MVLDAKRTSCDPCKGHAVLSVGAPCITSQDDLVQSLTHLFLAFKYVHLKQRVQNLHLPGQMFACSQTEHPAGMPQSWTASKQ